MKLDKIDKTLVASVALHVLVIGWGLLSFSSRAFELPPQDAVAVDTISEDQLAKVMAGTKSGKKENPKPLVEKVAEAEPPPEEAVGKITEKAPVVTETTPPPAPKPKPEEKPVEKKPDPPKKVVEEKPKEEPKPVEKKPEPKVDAIAEALKKEEKKPPPPPKPRPQAAAKPAPTKPKTERTFDESKIAALLDKRDPSRHAVAGETLNSNAALGLAKGKAADNSATWGALFQSQVERCWKKPYGGIEAQRAEAAFVIRLKRDGTLEGMPQPDGHPATPYLRVYQESALRAIIECQPYNLPPAFFEEWKYFAPVFTDRRS
ncbi:MULTISPECIES: cell envelope integrity protein TolA [Rhodopseudomonas]|uniref:Membrane protein TolA n=1 Tax=Rhodopseudomonas palustris TaxID=1076 RepID=A0A0D7EUN6_RHOPL|nr:MULTISPECIES: cell envelope integrity protein TolA [Rhodopseudomonas]KIZ44351.1 membrane protein TolA [Rhodopseudomonas palustris]MDF3811461.1 cell envelope integrity protein TolA [Rhodopseudomonas sp. BAL398]WOK17393.1 cell envelope integrity protein TolA [Rhodopseudomonas sp. BAL398]